MVSGKQMSVVSSSFSSFAAKGSSICIVVAMMLAMFTCHGLLERVHHKYCRSNVLFVLLYGNSTYCSMLSYSTRVIETFVLATINQVLKGVV